MEHDSSKVSLNIKCKDKSLGLFSFNSQPDLLDHVKYFLCSVEPNIVVWNGHGLKSNLFGILEVGVRSPYPVEPFYGQQLIFSRHVGRQPETMIIPLLAKKYVCHIGLQGKTV